MMYVFFILFLFWCCEVWSFWLVGNVNHFPGAVVQKLAFTAYILLYSWHVRQRILSLLCCDFVSQNKEFIYRGNDYEKFETFHQRLLAEFAEASLLHTNSPPDDAIKTANAQCILTSYNDGVVWTNVANCYASEFDQRNVAGGMVVLPVHSCVLASVRVCPETLLTRNLAECLTQFHQMYINDA